MSESTLGGMFVVYVFGSIIRVFHRHEHCQTFASSHNYFGSPGGFNVWPFELIEGRSSDKVNFGGSLINPPQAQDRCDMTPSKSHRCVLGVHLTLVSRAVIHGAWSSVSI